MSGFKQGGFQLYTYPFHSWWLPLGSLSIGYTCSIKNGTPSLAIDGLLKTLDSSNEPQVVPSLFATFELVLDVPNSLFLTSIDAKFGFDHDIDAKHWSYASPHVPKVEINVKNTHIFLIQRIDLKIPFIKDFWRRRFRGHCCCCWLSIGG